MLTLFDPASRHVHWGRGTVMARIQLVLPNEDRDRFVHAANAEGVSLSEWLRLAARERMQRSMERQRFRTKDDVTAFFEQCDSHAPSREPASEPDWEEHLDRISLSRNQSRAET